MAAALPNYLVPDLELPLKYHAFITHCDEDVEFAVNLMCDIEDMGFKCVFAKRDFMPGNAVVDNISTAIHRSRWAVLIISNASLKSPWCKFEMLAAIDDTNRSKRISFIPVLRPDVKEDDLPNTLRFVTYVRVDDHGHQHIDEIAKALAAPDTDWDSHIPIGNVATGLAWSYYYGYLRLVLPDIDKRMQDIDWQDGEDDNGRKICKKMLLLFPESCRCRDTLTEGNNQIKHAGHLKPVRRNRAGTVGREYKSTVYSVTDKDGEIYYFVGEYVTSIHVMHEMEQSGFAGLKTDDKNLQATRFLITIKDILSRDSACAHKYWFISYKDTGGENIPELIMNAIRDVIRGEDLSLTVDCGSDLVNDNGSFRNTFRRKFRTSVSLNTGEDVSAHSTLSKDETCYKQHAAETVRNLEGKVIYLRQGSEYNNLL